MQIVLYILLIVLQLQHWIGSPDRPTTDTVTPRQQPRSPPHHTIDTHHFAVLSVNRTTAVPYSYAVSVAHYFGILRALHRHSTPRRRSPRCRCCCAVALSGRRRCRRQHYRFYRSIIFIAIFLSTTPFRRADNIDTIDATPTTSPYARRRLRRRRDIDNAVRRYCCYTTIYAFVRRSSSVHCPDCPPIRRTSGTVDRRIDAVALPYLRWCRYAARIASTAPYDIIARRTDIRRDDPFNLFNFNNLQRDTTNRGSTPTDAYRP